MKQIVVAAVAVALVMVGAPAEAHELGRITGTVTADGGGPLEGICVFVGGASWGFATTGPDGTYAVGDLETGSHRVSFEDCTDDREYVSEYYDDAANWVDADPVMVQAGADTTGIDAGLAFGGWITGTVTGPDGSAAQGICVWAGASGQGGTAPAPQTHSSLPPVVIRLYGSNVTDAAGVYRVGGLAEGAHTVGFSDCNENPVYMREWYDGAHRPEDADPVQVTLGQGTEGIDASLDVGGVITGTVTDGQGNPISGICVSASGEGFGYGYDTTGADGVYRLGALGEDGYRIEFSDCSGWPSRYMSEYYDDAHSYEAATVLYAGVGQVIEGIDAVLEPPGDLALTRLNVRNVPLRTDQGELVSPGTNRQVEVTVSNVGGARGFGTMYVEACPVSTDLCRLIGYEWVELPAAKRLQRTYTWNQPGAGDYTIRAYVEAYDDPDPSNNQRTVDHYLIVGGTGAGV